MKFCKTCNTVMQMTTAKGWYYCPHCCLAYEIQGENETESFLKQILEKHKEEWRERIKALLIESEDLQKQEEPTMKVSYNGFTGELVKLEQIKKSLHTNCLNTDQEEITVYNISIYDAEKKVTHSFTNVNLKDVKFLGGSVSFD